MTHTTTSPEARLEAARTALAEAKRTERRTLALQRAAVQRVSAKTRAARDAELAAARAATEAARREYIAADAALDA